MSEFQSLWIETARELDIKILIDADVEISSGIVRCVPLVVCKFGGDKGMVVVHDWNQIRSVSDDLLAEGYGYSVMSGPDCTDTLDLQTAIEVLRDWGWRGAEELKPGWY